VFHVVLYQPEIPPNTGNIIRLCANSGAALHLIRPLSFSLDDRQLKRAGLDYHEYSSVSIHDDFAQFVNCVRPGRIFAFTTKSEVLFHDARFQPDNALLFGPETRGLPASIMNTIPTRQRLRIPMRAQSRSLNLSNAVAIAVYEAWRQQNFMGHG